MGSRLDEVQEIFRDVLGEPDLLLSRQSDANKVEGWDSLAHIDLITAVEQRFHIKFGLGELQGLKNVGDMLDVIDTKLAAK